MDLIVTVYVLVGILLGYRLSQSEVFALGKDATFFQRVFYGTWIAVFWPIALLNFHLHFRSRDEN